MSEALGWDEGLADALSLLGLERVFIGDTGGIADLERSVELARTTDLGTLARVVNLLAVAHQVLGDLESAYQARLEGLQPRSGSARTPCSAGSMGSSPTTLPSGRVGRGGPDGR